MKVNYTKTLLIFIILILFFMSGNVEMYGNPNHGPDWSQDKNWSKHSAKHNSENKGIKYLDRHPVDCSRKGIKGFDVNQVDGINQRFDYDCAGGEESDDFWIKTNEGSEGGQDLSYYANSFPVDCGHYPLTFFQYQRNGSGKNWHKFKCGKKATTGPCRVKSSSFSAPYSVDTEWLSLQQPLECDDGEVLTRVEYEYNGHLGRYKGQCCKK